MLTINYEFYNKIIELALLNEVPEGAHMYYNEVTEDFELHSLDAMRNPNLILTPCEYHMKGEIWRVFYAMLDPEQFIIAKSYPYRRGFFEYLRETGLDGIYELARMIVVIRRFKRWLYVNDITIFNDILEQ